MSTHSAIPPVPPAAAALRQTDRQTARSAHTTHQRSPAFTSCRHWLCKTFPAKVRIQECLPPFSQACAIYWTAPERSKQSISSTHVPACKAGPFLGTRQMEKHVWSWKRNEMQSAEVRKFFKSSKNTNQNTNQFTIFTWSPTKQGQ